MDQTPLEPGRLGWFIAVTLAVYLVLATVRLWLEFLRYVPTGDPALAITQLLGAALVGWWVTSEER